MKWLISQEAQGNNLEEIDRNASKGMNGSIFKETPKTVSREIPQVKSHGPLLEMVKLIPIGTPVIISQ